MPDASAFHAPTRPRWAERAFAWAWGHAHGPLERYYGAIKQDLFTSLTGRVLEIGPGAGINLRHFPKDTQLIGVEPNPFMHPRLQAAAAEAGHRMEVLEGYAENLPLEEASVDAVVSTLVLCSVHDPARALAEVRRVLRPGGRFYFLEHVAAPQGAGLRRVQDAIAPVWRCLGDGCNPNRDTAASIQMAGFTSVAMEARRIPVPLFPVTPHIFGVATR